MKAACLCESLVEFVAAGENLEEITSERFQNNTSYSGTARMEGSRAPAADRISNLESKKKGF